MKNDETNRRCPRTLHPRVPEATVEKLRKIGQRMGLAVGTVARIALMVWAEHPTVQEPSVPSDLIQWLEEHPNALSLVTALHGYQGKATVKALDQIDLEALLEAR